MSGLMIFGWRVWVVFGQNSPLFMAERDKTKKAYLFHLPYVSLAVVNWDAL